MHKINHLLEKNKTKYGKVYIRLIDKSINCIYVWIIANMIRACMLMKILLIIVLNTEKNWNQILPYLGQYQRLLTNSLNLMIQF